MALTGGLGAKTNEPTLLGGLSMESDSPSTQIDAMSLFTSPHIPLDTLRQIYDMLEDDQDDALRLLRSAGPIFQSKGMKEEQKRVIAFSDAYSSYASNPEAFVTTYGDKPEWDNFINKYA